MGTSVPYNTFSSGQFLTLYINLTLFSFLDVFLIVGVSQGLFITLTMFFVPQKNKRVNNLLSCLILIACLMLFGRISWGKINLEILRPIGVLADTTLFLFGPLLYLYVRNVSNKETSTFKLKWWHYIPAIIHLMYFFWYLLIPQSSYTSLYQEFPLRLFIFLIELGGFISCSSYWVKSFLFLKKVQRLSTKQYSFEPFILNYLKLLLAPLLLCFLLWGLIIIGYFTPFRLPSFINYNAIWVVIPLFFYIVGFASLIKPNLLRVKVNIESTKQESKQRLSENSILLNKEKLEYIMQIDKVFTNPELSLSGLAQLVEVSPNDLSWLLNDVYQQNFYTFINQYRVHEFVNRLKANDHKKQTILAIALDVGFNSKSTFNKFFKSIFHQTPSEYIKTLNSSQ